MKKKIEKKQLELNQYDLKITDSQKKLDEAQNDLNFGLSRLENAQNKYFEIANEEIKRLSGFFNEFTVSKQNDLDRQSFLQNEIIELEEKINESSQISINDTELYSNYDSVVEMNNEIAKNVLDVNQELVEQITNLNEALTKIPVYNFGKRNTVKRQLIDLKKKFGISATNYLKDFIDETKSNVENERSLLSQNKTEVNEITVRLVNVDKNIETLNARIEKLKLENEFLINNIGRINRKSLDDFTFHSDAKKYVEAYKRNLVNLNTVEYYTKSIDDLIRLHPTEEDFAKVEEEMKILKLASKVLKMVSLSSISKNIYFKELTTLYRKYNQKYTSTNYRHKLYLKLLLASLYGAKINVTDKFINIDEAQDISVMEYRLIQSILRKDVVFNLYGDVNQLVYSYKGIQDWCDINGINMDNIYVLNENYRNTIQITDFCNKEFESEIYPIGIAGNKVEELDIFDAMSWIKKIRKNNSNYRTAIIYRHGKKTVHDVISQILNQDIVSWYDVDDNKISVLTVEEAKGLEFEVVIAIVDEMTDNEKYISYTRALSHLCVVRNVFEEKEIEENFDEKTLEENYDF